jgi:nucleotide-binding universal stress UspA family protein
VSPPPRSDLLDSLDDSKISRFQIKIMFVSGMGFFTDAYDLFVIGIAVGIDGSPHSEAALRWSVDLAEARQGELTAVFSWQVPFMPVPMAFDRDQLEQEYKRYLVEVVSAVMPAPPAPLHTVVAEGDSAESLLIASQNADLLVLGTRGRSPFAGMVLGSVSQRCAAAALCPVVLVKAAEPARP